MIAVIREEDQNRNDLPSCATSDDNKLYRFDESLARTQGLEPRSPVIGTASAAKVRISECCCPELFVTIIVAIFSLKTDARDIRGRVVRLYLTRFVVSTRVAYPGDES